MTVYGIISKLDNAGIKVWVDSGQLKVKAPKGALTKALKAELVEYKAELLQFLPTVGAGGKKEDAIPLIARDGDLALSYAQKRMWFLAQLEPSNTAYHIRTALEIRGALDIHALQRAIKKLKHRHESLRTTFIETDGVPLQRINPEAAFVLPVEQLGEDNLKTLFSQFVDAPFDLETGPLFRADLVQLADDHYALMIAMHHIISDGWSTAVMVGELSALYASCSMNLPDALPAVAIQYVDYAYWQKSWLSGEREDRQLKYWTHQLADVPVLELLTDFSRPPVKSTAGGLVSFELDSVMAKQAKAMAQEKRATLFMVLLSAFNCLLYRYTGQTDFAVGSPIANRPNAQFEGTVGLFVNTLAMRARFNEGDSYADHLSSVRSMSLDAFEHQDIPFERIVDVMGVSRDMSHTPIFQVMFVLQNTPGEAKVKLPGVVVEELKFDRDTSPMDITMTLVEEKDGSISGELEYCTDLFSPETAQQICRHYVSFLQGVLNNPSQLVVQVDYLSAVEKQCLLQRWGTQQQSYDSDQTLDGWFEQIVKCHPDNIALTESGMSLTYTDLNSGANQLARHLLTMGVGRKSFVGISLERSANVVIAILAVLKTGATYVPVDPANPAERIKFILDDARVNIVITDAESKEIIPSPTEGRSYVEIGQPTLWEQYSSDNLSDEGREHDRNDIAYVIYTSGTTGKPKGVQIPHSNVERLFHATNTQFGFDENDVWSLFHSYAFDFSVWEMWGALLYGGRVVIVPKMVARAPSAFFNLILKEGVTVLNQTPTAFTHLIKEDEAWTLETGDAPQLKLRYVIFGGEALDFAALQTWVERHGLDLPKLINMYGITETTVHVTYHEVTEADLRSKRSLIGRPIADLSLYILDAELQPVPSGIAGEMYVGGAGLAKGYLHRPDLTAERFIAIPSRLATDILASDINSIAPVVKGDRDNRLYKTGDIARYLRDEEESGLIEYLGRADDQVKIRGFRIELGEIESSLTAHAKVHGSVATLYTNINIKGQGQDHIIAYVDGDAPDVVELRAYLQGCLPEYMVPTQIIVLDRLPLTSNGKVDKKALPAPDFELVAVENFVAPCTDDEVAILNIWQEVLGVTRISTDVNFFEIGGHSLLATQVISRIRRLFNIELSLRSIFESSTIELLAELVATARQTQSGVDTPPVIVCRPDDAENVLTFAQHRLWFIDQLDQNISAYNLPFALLFTGKLNADELEQAFQVILGRHSVLCTQYLEKDGVPHTTRKNPSTWCLEQVALVTDVPADSTSMDLAKNANIKSVIETHAEILFDLASDWLFIAKLIRCNTEQHLLLINMHHIVSDGWSMGVMISELKVLLNSQDKASILPPLGVEYEDYAYWQRQWLQGDNLENLKQYWIAVLAGAPAVLRLPTDYPRPEKSTFNGAHLNIDLGVDTTKALQVYCEENAVTPFMVLMAAYQIFLGRYTHQEDICVGIPIANRNQFEIEGLIGFFVNGLIIRGRQQGNPTRRAFIDSIKDVALGAFAHQDMSMDVLIDALQLSGGGGYSPGAQVAFALQNMPNLEALSMPGLEVEILEREHKTAKYELTLMLEERGESIGGVFEFNTDLFKPETVALMAIHYKNVLRQMLEDPDQTIATVELVLKQELKKVLSCDQENVQLFPLSPTQRDVYLDIIREPDSLRNSIGSSCLFRQNIDMELFQQGFEELVGQLPLMKAQLLSSELPYVDLAYFKNDSDREFSPTIEDFSATEWSDADILGLVHKTVYQPYDLYDGALYRFHIFKLDEERTLLVISVCHLIADGAGMFNSFQNLFRIVQDIKDGHAPVALNDNLQEYVNRSRQTFDRTKTIEYWEEQSRGLEALQFSMPCERMPCGQSVSVQGAEDKTSGRIEETISFQKKEFDEIKFYCSELGIHPATYFKTLYVLLLHYYCRPQSNFYFTEILGGRSKQFRHTFGCLFQTLPTIIPQELMGSDKTVAEVIEFLQGYKMSTRRYDKISQLSQNKILPRAEQDFLYNYYNFISQVTWNDETVTLQPHPQIQDGPVQFIAQEFEDHFLIQLVFNDSLFDSLGFLERLSQLSKQLISGVEALTELDFLLPEEKLPVDGTLDNSIEISSVESSMTVVDKIIQRSAISPETIAIKYGGAELNYEEFDKSSAQWAGLLREKGIEDGDRVVVCLEPGLILFSVLLGILRAGASYVPVDVDYPAERIRYIVEDSDAQCWITQNCVLSRVTQAGVNIDADKLVLVEQASTQLAGFVSFDTCAFHPTPDSMMYVIYTSGSTGQPKGAGVYHRGVSNLLGWYKDELQITEKDACLLVSSVGFDLTQKNPWVAFCAGAKLVIPVMDQYDPEAIARSLVEESITWLNCAPSAFYPLVEAGDLDGYPFKSLRHVVLGGESIRLETLNQWLWTDHGQVSLMNSYGPTECTDVVAAYSYSTEQKWSSLPIGKAIPGVDLYIINERHQQLAPGFIGELCIAGVAVGAGYLDKLELTEAAFIQNPFGKGLLYKTGDLVRLLRGTDGLIEYIGRKDFQVKVRGLRIELGEIEFTLRQQEGVLDALVMVKEDQIIAYALSAGPDKPIDNAMIKQGLRLSLPEYMVPHLFVIVDKWPLTPNGKIDRKALPDPVGQSPQEFIAPASDSEIRLANIWCDVLNIEKVGILDSFFDLGGHSLLAARVISKLRKEFKVEVSLRVIFEMSTVSEIAEYIDRLNWAMQSQNHGESLGQNQGESGDGVEEGFL